jgi:hypothetical protein
MQNVNPSMPKTKSSDRYGLVVAGFAILTALSSFVVPLGTLSRSFGGEGALLVHPGRILDFTGRLPNTMPDFSSVTLVTWLLILSLLILAGLAFTRSKFTLLAGVLVIVLTMIDMGFFIRAIDLIQAPLLAAGTTYRKLPYRWYCLQLGTKSNPSADVCQIPWRACPGDCDVAFNGCWWRGNPDFARGSW